jgi:hypothetical protein
MGKYEEVFAVLKRRGHTLLADLELVCFNRFQVGQYLFQSFSSGSISCEVRLSSSVTSGTPFTDPAG